MKLAMVIQGMAYVSFDHQSLVNIDVVASQKMSDEHL